MARETPLWIAQVDSGFNPLTVGVSGTPRIVVSAAIRADAAERPPLAQNSIAGLDACDPVDLACNDAKPPCERRSR